MKAKQNLRTDLESILAKLDAVLLDRDLQNEGESAFATIPGNFHVLRP